MSKKALKKNAAYWRGRFTALEDKQYRKTAEYYDKVKRIFSHAEAEAKDKLAAWYNRLAINNEISYADAFKLLKADELEEFHWTVQEYIDRGKNVGLDPKWEKQLENASAKVHVSRLEEIQTELKATVENLYSEYETGTAAHLSSIANDSYYHTAYEVAKGTGIGTTFHRLDSRTLTKLLTTPWGKDEEDFSDRIWQRRDKLIQTLNDELAHNLILGLDPQKSIDKIAEDFEVDKRAAGRLVMTESAAIGSMAREASLKELEVEEFEIVATLDSHTSTICQQMDGQHFPMSKFKVGTTAPPFHPNCRSTTVPYFNDEFTADETRAARDANDKGYERVPSDMTYKEWKEKFVKNKNVVADFSKDGIIKVGIGGSQESSISAGAVNIPNQYERSRIIREAIATKRPFYAENLRWAYNANGIKPKEGCYDVLLHGSPTCTEYEGKYILDNETLQYIISGRPDWNGSDIRLISCSTGMADENGDCVAQYLADHLKVNVYAPIDTVTIGQGKLSVGPLCEMSEEEGFKWFYCREGGSDS